MTQRFQATLDVTIRATEQVHTLREMTQTALSIESVSNAVTSASNSLSEHYHAYALALEKKCRAEAGTVFKAAGNTGSAQYVTTGGDLEVLKKARALFKADIGEEILWLQREKGWQKDKLPRAGDQAFRKIVNAWAKGMSLLTLDTCSMCAKATKMAGDEEDQAIVTEAGKGSRETKTGGVELTGNPAVDKALKSIIESARVGVENDSKTVVQSLEAYEQKLSGITKRLVASLVSVQAG